MSEEDQGGCEMSDIYTALIWPPAVPFSKDIEVEVAKHYSVHASSLYKFGNDEFRKFVFKVYKPDKTPSARIKRKYKVMAKSKRFVRLVEIEVDNSTMVPHKKTRLKGKFFCREMKSLKRVIREMFSPRVKGYVYDVVFHVSDNEDHNRRNRKLLGKYGKKT